ncbi:Protein of unknown function [Cotesia congregata]|uniref:Uncharacterized protein n=1 Tax=Cotesia congregata TaxID=51543 RepID=A0A8J2H937_COTCN|nr:Protein of unknown function [Cotesia congregata]
MNYSVLCSCIPKMRIPEQWATGASPYTFIAKRLFLFWNAISSESNYRKSIKIVKLNLISQT